MQKAQQKFLLFSSEYYTFVHIKVKMTPNAFFYTGAYNALAYFMENMLNIILFNLFILTPTSVKSTDSFI